MKSEEKEEVKEVLLAMIEESCEVEMTTRSIREETEEPNAKRRKTRRKQLL